MAEMDDRVQELITDGHPQGSARRIAELESTIEKLEGQIRRFKYAWLLDDRCCIQRLRFVARPWPLALMHCFSQGNRAASPISGWFCWISGWETGPSNIQQPPGVNAEHCDVCACHLQDKQF